MVSSTLKIADSLSAKTTWELDKLHQLHQTRFDNFATELLDVSFSDNYKKPQLGESNTLVFQCGTPAEIQTASPAYKAKLTHAVKVAKANYQWGYGCICAAQYFSNSSNQRLKNLLPVGGFNKTNGKLPSGAEPSAFDTAAIKLQTNNPVSKAWRLVIYDLFATDSNVPYKSTVTHKPVIFSTVSYNTYLVLRRPLDIIISGLISVKWTRYFFHQWPFTNCKLNFKTRLILLYVNMLHV